MPDREALHLLPTDVLLSRSLEIQRNHWAGKIEPCAIVNSKSGACSQDCRFCAQSAAHQTGIKSYPLLSIESITEAARY